MLDRATPPPVHTMGPVTLPLPQSATLSNGIKFHTIRGGSQEIVQLSVTWQGGCLEAPHPMVATLMASLMTEGTSSHSGTEISEMLDFHGAMLRVSASQHVTTLQLTALNSMLSDVMPLVREIICEPAFPQLAFDTFHEIETNNFLLAHSKVSVLCSEALAPLIKGPSHPESRVPTLKEVKDISLVEVKEFYNALVTANGCNAYLGGNFTEEIYDSVRQMLESLPVRGLAMQREIVPYVALPPEKVVVEKPGSVQAAVEIGIPAVSRSHPDYIPLRLSVMALGGYFGSRLMKNIREDKGYTYGIASYLLGNQEGSYISIMAQTDTSYVDAVIAEVAKEMEQLADEPLPAEEMMRLRQHASSNLLEILDSPFAIIDHYKVIDSVGLPDGYFDEQVHWVHTISPDIIKRMARMYIQPSLMRIAVCR